jgi:hypothetical protein
MPGNITPEKVDDLRAKFVGRDEVFIEFTSTEEDYAGTGNYHH